MADTQELSDGRPEEIHAGPPFPTANQNQIRLEPTSNLSRRGSVGNHVLDRCAAQLEPHSVFAPGGNRTPQEGVSIATTDDHSLDSSVTPFSQADRRLQGDQGRGAFVQQDHESHGPPSSDRAARKASASTGASERASPTTAMSATACIGA